MAPLHLLCWKTLRDPWSPSINSSSDTGAKQNNCIVLSAHRRTIHKHKTKRGEKKVRAPAVPIFRPRTFMDRQQTESTHNNVSHISIESVPCMKPLKAIDLKSYRCNTPLHTFYILQNQHLLGSSQRAMQYLITADLVVAVLQRQRSQMGHKHTKRYNIAVMPF